jgi:hypothetical protein
MLARIALLLHLLFVVAAPLAHAYAEGAAAREHVSGVELRALGRVASSHSEDGCQLCRSLGQALALASGVAVPPASPATHYRIVVPRQEAPRLHPVGPVAARAPPQA